MRMFLLCGWILVSGQAVAGVSIQYLGPNPPAKVQRVVTLAPSLTEMVVALGAEKVLCGVSRFDDLTEVASLPRVGGFVDPSVEAVLALRPDLVMVQPSPGNQKPVEKMAQLGIPVLVLPLDSVASVLQAMREVGRVLGREKEGQRLAGVLEETRARLKRQSATKTKVSVLFAYDFQPLVVAGPGSFAHELLSDVGAYNACDVKASYAVYALEKTVAHPPQVVVDASESSLGVEAVRTLPGLKNARWVKLPSKNLMHPGPRLAQGVEELFQLLHPEEKAP